jgi:monoamine oxidase
MSVPLDVLIIGAGIAGLTAAREISTAGLRVLMLEGRDRIGGRILTHHTPEYPVELGAEFVHGRPPEICDLIKDAGLKVAELQWKVARRKANRWIENDKIMDAVERVFKKMRADQPDQSFQEFIDHVPAEPEEKEQALRFVEGFHAADPRRVSVHSLIRSNAVDQQIDGDRQFRFAEGYDTLVKGMSDGINWKSCEQRLNTPVAEIQWKTGESLVRTTSGLEFSAPRCIVTVPLGVLKAGGLRFHPALAEKEQALRGLEMGPVRRVSLCFRDKFWEAVSEFRDVSFLLTDDARFPAWWTSNPLPFPILTGWAAGHYVRALAQLSTGQVIEHAMESLAPIFGMDIVRLRRELQDGFTHNWQADRFSCGAYSYAVVGGSDAGRDLAAPVAGTLFFAGEATDADGHNGTVHGAIASGRRAAKEVLGS